jgi:radical SAM enzyme (TIGR01210 family)
MCDLWKNTLLDAVPAGGIPTQIEYALQRLAPARQVKLYNSGSFFDLQAIPLQDYSAITTQVSAFERVIVESHPALVGENCFAFSRGLAGKLEVAMGLETVHPQILERLNKRMTTSQFAAAAEKLREHDIDLRVFILVKPPFMREEEAVEWAARSLDFAFDCGATAATLIPTRSGNGALDELARRGEFAPPCLDTLEEAVAYGLLLRKGRVFVDLWDVSSATCQGCFAARMERLRLINLRQKIGPPTVCEFCGAGN